MGVDLGGENVTHDLTARRIARHIVADRYRESLVVPNYTPSGWFEADVFQVTKAGYFREYEVKIDRADFRADADKRSNVWKTELGRWRLGPGRSKHDRLTEGDPTGPTKFWFVVPTGLVQLVELPKWAGLIYVREHMGRLYSTEIVPAPQLHREKLAQSTVDHARGVCYWRFLDLWMKDGRK